MDMRIDPTIIPQQSTVISHRQIIAVRLLQMAGQELTMAIARESESNPAFEADERESCHAGQVGRQYLRRGPRHGQPVTRQPVR